MKRWLAICRGPLQSWFARATRQNHQRVFNGLRRKLGSPFANLAAEVQQLEVRTLLTVSIAHNFAGLDFNSSGGYVPPDTCSATGPSSTVETVNQEVRLFTAKTSASGAVSSSLSNFLFTVGGLPRADGTSRLSDPIVAYDELAGRFIIGDQDVNFTTHVSNFDIAVSKTNNPTTLTTSSWNFYSISTTETGSDADYPGNFGYNHDAFVFTLNMFPGGSVDDGKPNQAAADPQKASSPFHVLIVSVNMADLAAGVASPHVFKNDDSSGASLRPTTMHDSVAGDPMWLIQQAGDGNHIQVVKMTNVLSNSASLSTTSLTVNSYSAANHPLNPDGSVITTNMDSRILKVAEANNSLVAAHTVAVSGTEDDVQWYRINVSSGTPVLADQGRVSAGNNTYLYFPGIDINSAGDIGMSYMRSGNDTSTDFMSMYVTGRKSTDTPGTMETPVLVPSGTGVAIYHDFTAGGRAGDLSGINVDPTNGTFWAANEYANQESSNWGTAIANFTLGTVVQNGVIEDFESGNLSLYNVLPNVSPTAFVSTLARHDGSDGLLDGPGNDWIYRTDGGAQVGRGDTLSVWVRFSKLDGRAYFGFGSSATGTLSLTAAPKTKQLLLQKVDFTTNTTTGGTFTDVASTFAKFAANKWFRLEVVWGSNGDVTGNLYNSTGIRIATVSASNSTFNTSITSGGIAFRSISSKNVSWDTVNDNHGVNSPISAPTTASAASGAGNNDFLTSPVATIAGQSPLASDSRGGLLQVTQPLYVGAVDSSAAGVQTSKSGIRSGQSKDLFDFLTGASLIVG